MIQYLLGVCFLIICLDIPAQATTTMPDKPAPSTSSKTLSKGSASAVPAVAAAANPCAKSQIQRKALVSTPTLDLSRADAALAALKPSPTPAPSASRIAPTVALAAHAAPIPPAPTAARAATAGANPAKIAKASPSTRVYPEPGIPSPELITRNSLPVTTHSGPVATVLDGDVARDSACARLARVTAYWAGEGDYYTGRCIAATGVRLHDGHCAVDPNIIPYGSIVEIPGVGKYIAVDTGSAVISRTAARESGHTSAERGALVIDIFFEDSDAGERFAAAATKYAAISWWTPSSTDTQAKAARSLFADENWTKIQNKQL